MDRMTFANRKQNRKGQLEVIGLVFIVIIVSMAMLFYLSYSVNKKENTIYKEYANNELAQSYASVFTKMSVCGTEMSKLLEDCTISKRIVCEGGKSSCTVINETILFLLNETLNKWDHSYGFTIKWTDNPLTDYNSSKWYSIDEDIYYFDDERWVYSRRNCTEISLGPRSSPGFGPVPIGRTKDTITVEVGICGQ